MASKDAIAAEIHALYMAAADEIEAKRGTKLSAAELETLAVIAAENTLSRHKMLISKLTDAELLEELGI